MFTDKDLECFRRIGDPVVDKLVDQLPPPDDPGFPLPVLGRWEPGQSMKDLPTLIRDYLCAPMEWPAWADASRLLTAQQAYNKHRLRARLVLAHYSLPVAYLHAETSLTLTLTGQLLTHPRRRLLETVRFVETMMQPGSFSDNGKGVAWVRKVRMTHALVRQLIQSRTPTEARPKAPKLSQPAFGFDHAAVAARLRAMPQPVRDRMPLDQVELAFVLQSFGWVMVDGLNRFNHRMATDEAHEYVFAWSMIGHALGIDKKLLPHTGAGAPTAQGLHRRIRDRLLAAGAPPGASKDPQDTWLAGHLLTAALVSILTQIMRERVPDSMQRWLRTFPALDRAMQALPRTLIRRCCGSDAANHLRVGRAPLLHWLVGEIALRLIDLDQAADYPVDSAPPARDAGFALPAYLTLPR